jgi:hypothetical protein
VKEQLAAFEHCLEMHGSLEECVLLFESLDTANEKVFFHCDQVRQSPFSAPLLHKPVCTTCKN